MLATLVIFLREGVEASMIVAILLAYLNRIGQREHFRDVFLGVGAALVLAGGGGVAAYLTIRSYDGSRVQTIFETATYLVAAAVLTYMTFWMRDHARSLSSELRKRTDAALDGRARWGLGLLAFQAVGREGLETVVFTLAIVFSRSAARALGGAAIGLAGAPADPRPGLHRDRRAADGVCRRAPRERGREPAAARLAADADRAVVALGPDPVRGQLVRRRAAQLLRLQRCAHDPADTRLLRLPGDRDHRLPGAGLPAQAIPGR